MSQKILKRLNSEKKAAEEAYKKAKRYRELQRERKTIDTEIAALEADLGRLGYSDIIKQLKHVKAEPKMTRARTSKPAIELSYEIVTKTADEIMNQGFGVTASLLLERLGVRPSQKDAITKYLEQATQEGKYGKRHLEFRAHKYDIFSPIRQKFPVLLRGVNPESMKKLQSGIESLAEQLKEFDYVTLSSHLESYAREFKVNKGTFRGYVNSILLYLLEIGKLETENHKVYRFKPSTPLT